MVNLCYVRSFVVQIAYDTNINVAYVVHRSTCMCTYVYLCMCVCMRVVMLLVLCVSRVITFRFLQASPSRRKLISFAVCRLDQCCNSPQCTVPSPSLLLFFSFAAINSFLDMFTQLIRAVRGTFLYFCPCTLQIRSQGGCMCVCV